MGKIIDITVEIIVSLAFLWHVWIGEWQIAGVLIAYLVWCAVKKLNRRSRTIIVEIKVDRSKKK